MKKITVFCGSNAGNIEAYIKVTDQLARVLVEQGISLIYGAGKVGLMGRLADGVLRRGGEVIGVIPEKLVRKEGVHKGISVLHIVKTMHERNALMAELCDGFIALPGGKIEEIIELFTWSQAGDHNKACGLLNIDGYYDKRLAFMQVMTDDKFPKAKSEDMLIIEKNPVVMIQQMQEMELEHVVK
ncbi:TIGR00730 family Rossman fold protein [Rhodocytophaga rosea]|uniref:Cytokinin riboside 5'-monophosphate phosphoribohydrolase n=1 Tax=Rhodocytophaga rosea TaxID=2704465 RepID=A0A6C0GIQ4_9BACT|nr:TIGR00730 family Rossman fold protein [Rhodocytophaga rosea]QHT67926.1 TIGR00730 family Rossman fold protein [Rhodocytophaga rosea]